jgi:hypothetical protein
MSRHPSHTRYSYHGGFTLGADTRLTLGISYHGGFTLGADTRLTLGISYHGGST